jgi:hypothetical protein
MRRISARRIGLYALIFALYLASTVPVGLFLYSVKSAVGLDIFSEGGFHTFMQCLDKSFPLRTSDRLPNLATRENPN